MQYEQKDVEQFSTLIKSGHNDIQYKTGRTKWGMQDTHENLDIPYIDEDSDLPNLILNYKVCSFAHVIDNSSYGQGSCIQKIHSHYDGKNMK